MRIGIHATIISKGKYGHYTYFKNLLSHLISIDKVNEYVFFYNYFKRPEEVFFLNKNQLNIQERFYRFPARFLEFVWGKCGILPIETLIGKLDIFHSLAFHLSHPDFYLPPLTRGKLIVTVHDIIPLKFPQYYSKQYVQGCKRGLELASKKTAMIITDSLFFKNAIREMVNIKEEKIRVIPLAADEQFSYISDREKLTKVLKSYSLLNKYILFVGGTNPTKNLTRLIEAIGILRETLRNEYNLVLVGKKQKEYRQISQQIRRLKLENIIIFTGYIPERELPYIYNGAELFVFPSLCEGFGLPPLEAMACGVPVITSNVSSLPEVVDDAAVLVDPYNVEDIAQAIKKVLQDTQLQNTLSKKGLERVKKFSWEKTALQTLEVYREIGAR